MIESEKKKPDYFEMAENDLNFSFEDRNIFDGYKQEMLLAAYVFMDTPGNEGKNLSFEEAKGFAEKRYPGSWLLVNKVLKKAEELEQSIKTAK